MSLDKAIQHGKERRRPYYRSGKYDRTCRPHGGCPWCRRNRLYADRKWRYSADEQTMEWSRNE